MSRTIVRHAYPAVLAGMFISSALVLGAHSTAVAASAAVQDLRVGEHPGATRIVLDVSQRTDATFDVSSDGRTLFVTMPNADWKAGDFAAKHAKGMLTDFKQSKSSKGLELSLVLDQPVRMKPPFFVSPEGTQGDRVVIDLVPDTTMAAAAKTPAKAIPSPSPTGVGATFTQPATPNVPLASAQTAPRAASSAAMMPPTDVAMEKRSAAAAPVEVAQATYNLQPSKKSAETAQATQPQGAPATRPMQPPQDNSGFGGLLYIKAAAGLSVMEEANAQGSGNDAAIETDFGWVANGGLGIDLKNGFRLEGEVLYASNAASAATGTMNSTGVNSAQTEGDVSLLGFMANLAYDFNTPYAINPYIFGGAGIASLKLDGVGQNGNVYDSSDTVFAMQGGAGLSTDLTDRTSLDLSYRYLETLKGQFSDASSNPFEMRYQTHMIMMGMRYKL